MVEVTNSGTVLMSPDDIKRERDLREAEQRLASIQRFEEQKRMWHSFSKLLPWAAGFMGLCLLGIMGFTAFKIMSDAWAATDWIW